MACPPDDEPQPRPKYLTAYDKSERTHKLIRSALRRNTLFSRVENDPEVAGALLNAFRRVEVEPGQVVVRQGCDCNKFYVVESGDFHEEVTEATRTPTRLGMASRKTTYTVDELGPGNSFGDFALYHGQPAPMTVRAGAEGGVVWAIDRRTFQLNVVRDARQREILDHYAAISSVVEQHSFFQHLDNPATKQELIESFFVVRFKAGEEVIRQGQHPDNFYIVSEGELLLERELDLGARGEGDEGEKMVETEAIHAGEGVGELAIKFPNQRAKATVRAKTDVTLFAIERHKFMQMSKTGARVLRNRFDRYASIQRANGSRLMTVDDFLRCNTKDHVPRWQEAAQEVGEPDAGADHRLFRLLFKVAAHGNRVIDFHDYYMFNMLMKRPYAEFEVAFRLFDVERKGAIDQQQFVEMMRVLMEASDVAVPEAEGAEGAAFAERLLRSVPRDMFGPDNAGLVSYEEFREHLKSGALPTAVRGVMDGIKRHQHWTVHAARALTDSALRGVDRPAVADSSGGGNQSAKFLVAGAVAGAVSRTAVAPFDRLVILMQTDTSGAYAGAGVRRGLGRIYAQDGALGFFRGNLTNMLRIAPSRSLQFFLFETLKQQLSDASDRPESELTFVERLVAGGLAGMGASTATYPLDMLRTRVTVASSGGGLVARAASVVRAEGVGALYKGLGATLLRIFPYIGMDFAVYETLKARGPPDGGGPVFHLLCGTAAGLVGQTLTYPLDTVRRRIQNHRAAGERAPGIVATARHIVATEGGVRGLYAGMVPFSLRSVPAVAVGFTVYEAVKSAWDDLQ